MKKKLFEGKLGAIGRFFILPKFLQQNNNNLKIKSKDIRKCYIQLYKHHLISTHILLNNFNIYDVEIRRLVRQKRNNCKN